MRNIILLVLLSSVCLNSFAKGKKKQGNEMISIAMRHTACFGRCPDYTIDVNRNGIATYTGSMFVTDSGVFTKKIGTKKALEIIHQAEGYRLDTCKDRYDSRAQDLPGIVYTIIYRSKKKVIQNANFGPAVLDDMRVTLDGLLNVKAEAGTLESVGPSWHKAAGSRK